MPKLSLSQPHQMAPEALRARVAQVEDKLRTKYGAQTSWVDAQTMSVEGPGVKGKLQIGPSTVSIDLNLGLMLAPFKSKIEEGLQRELVRVTRTEDA